MSELKAEPAANRCPFSSRLEEAPFPNRLQIEPNKSHQFLVKYNAGSSLTGVPLFQLRRQNKFAAPKSKEKNEFNQ
jgi:hypothetical protein